MAAVLAAGSLLASAAALVAAQEVAVVPAYANVEFVSVDPLRRLVVVKGSKGAQETLDLDDGFSVPAAVKAGDHVMITVRGEPGRRRISAMTKVTARPAAVVTTSTSPTPGLTATDLARVEVREAYANQVAALSQQARSTDSLWSSFVTTCAAKPVAAADGSRAWFGLWDGRVQSDLSGGFCRDLFNQIVASGEGVKKAMAAAEDVAHKTLEPGEMRDIRRLNSMDWDGWELTAPDRLAP
jgi:antitoxin (DNA-binding transcriptional repressor) of toxin-antitoxin stability system